MHTVDRQQHLESIPRDTMMVHMRTGVIRAVLFALLWWILTEGAMDSWLVGAPVVLFAALVSVLLWPPCAWSLAGLARFIPFFLWHSLRGGVDVARRVLHPRLLISPGMFDYRLRLPSGLPRVFMANIVSLLPGTLCAELDETCLRVHVLDDSSAFMEELRELEQQVASVFGIELACNHSSEV